MTTTEFPATPIEFDTKLAEIDGRLYLAQAKERDLADATFATVNRFHGRSKFRGTWVTNVYDLMNELAEIIENKADTREGQNVVSAHNRYLAQVEVSREIREEVKRWDAEFQARGGWTRAFLVVTNGQGHVHRSQGCSTCYPTTQFHWVTALSGHDEAEIVEAAGERACTVCYPSAPVETRNRPTTLFTPDEVAKQQARQEREAAKVAREAKRLEKALMPNGEPLVLKIAGWTEKFTTLASGRKFLTDAFSWNAHYNNGDTHPSFPHWAQDQVAEAVAAKEGKTVEQVKAEAKTRAAKRK
jgi:hypothetical protein